jgi:TRAP-type C4-dicarboxylate transport system, small permease component
MKAISWLDDNLERFCCTILFISFASVMIINVIMRFVFQNAIPWASDLVLFIFSWFVMIGMSYCVKTRSHIAVTFLTDRLSPSGQRACSILVNIILILFMALICYNGLRLLGDRSVVNKFGLLFRYPLWSMYLALPVGCALSVFRLVQNLREDLKASAKGQGE